MTRISYSEDSYAVEISKRTNSENGITEYKMKFPQFTHDSAPEIFTIKYPSKSPEKRYAAYFKNQCKFHICRLVYKYRELNFHILPLTEDMVTSKPSTKITIVNTTDIDHKEYTRMIGYRQNYSKDGKVNTIY